MRMRLRPSIGATICGAFVAMGLLTAGVGGYSLYILRTASGFVVELYDGPLMAINFDRAASLDFAEMDKERLRRATAPAAELAKIDASVDRVAKAFREDLAVAAERSTNPDERAVIGQIQALAERWNEIRSGGATAGPSAELEGLSASIIERLDFLAELAAGHSFVERRRVTSAINLFRYSGIAILIVALCLSAGIAVVLVRRIIKPLRGAAAVADRISEGELQTPIPQGGDDETGVLLHSLSVMQRNIRDMVEREQAQRRSAQNRLVDALENSREAIVLVDADDRVVIANSQLANFFPSLASRLDAGVTAAALEPLLGGPVAAATSGPEPAANDKELRLPDGRWVRISRSPTQEGGFFLVISDFSDVKEREQRLDEARHQAEAASAAKSTFLANMSHELRTPLNAIIGFSEILAKQMFGKLGSDSYIQYARDILDSGTHLLAVINSVLDLSKSEAGKLELVREEIDLREIVKSALSIVRVQCSRAGLMLNAELPPGELGLSADAAKLRQVLLNLLSNAVKFTEPGGTITLRAGRGADGGIVVQVVDTGIGMSPEDIPTALSAFGQVDTRLSRRYEGTGLGLPLSKAFVELHGGTLAVDSRPGDGTTVTVTLPGHVIHRAEAAA